MLTELPEATIHYGWLDLPESSTQCFEKALHDLTIWLGRAPICAPITVAPMPSDWLLAVRHAWGKASDVSVSDEVMSDAVANLAERINQSRMHLPRLVVGCTGGHPFARKAIEQAPHAQWGATCGRFALCYNCDNPYSVWHEALHTLGAQDCYDEKTLRPIGDCPGCLMQYAPDERTIGQSPWLCHANQERVRAAIRRNRSIFTGHAPADP